MGVQGLWSIINSEGETVELESLSKKILAIDASIWVHQFLKGIKDGRGEVIENAHIIGFLKRICKLVFYNIQPVFVFDGPPPDIKLRVLRKRKAHKDKIGFSLQSTAEKILMAKLQSTALDTIKNKHDESDEFKRLNSSDSFNRSKRNRDEFELPSLEDGLEKNMKYEDPRYDFDAELIEYLKEYKPDMSYSNIDNIDELPEQIKYELISELRLRSRQTSLKRMNYMRRNAPKAIDFSQLQIQNLVNRNALTQKYLDVVGIGDERHLPNVKTARVAAEKGKAFSLLKQENGGWSLSRETNTPTVKLEPSKQSKPVAKNDIIDATSFNTSFDTNFDFFDDIEEIEDEADYIEDNMDFKDISNENLTTSNLLNELNNHTNKILEPSDDDVEDDFEEIAVDDTINNNKRENEKEEVEELEKWQKYLDDGIDEDIKNSKQFYYEAINKWDLNRLQKKVEHYKELQKELLNPKFDQFVIYEEFLDTVIKLKKSQLEYKKFQSLSENKINKYDISGDDSFESISEISFDEISKPSENDVKELKRDNIIDLIREEEPSIQVDSIIDLTDEQNNGSRGELVSKNENNINENEVLIKSEDNSTDPFKNDLKNEISNIIKSNKRTTITDENKIDITATKLENQLMVDSNKTKPQEDTQKLLDIKPKSNRYALNQDVKDDYITQNETLNEPKLQKENVREQNDEVDAFKDNDKKLEAKVIDNGIIDITLDKDDTFKYKNVLLETKNMNININETTLDKHQTKEQINEINEEFIKQVKEKGVEKIQDKIEKEIKEMSKNQYKIQNYNHDPTLNTFEEIKQLLTLFGIPYIEAPSEAEAQCAELSKLGLVDGIVTEDSDVFLFGGTPVYKNMFNNNNSLLIYDLNKIEKNINLNRDDFIQLAYLLGSDYTIGLDKIGPVTAVEILSQFGNLNNFFMWWNDNKFKVKLEDNECTFLKKLFKLVKRIHINENFLDPLVADAYLNPSVDHSKMGFQWGTPDLEGLKIFLSQTINWNNEKTEQVIVPVIEHQKKLEKAKVTKITDYFKVVGKSISDSKSEIKPKAKSQRLKSALEKLKGSKRLNKTE